MYHYADCVMCMQYCVACCAVYVISYKTLHCINVKSMLCHIYVLLSLYVEWSLSLWYCKLRINSCNCWWDTFGTYETADKRDVVRILKNAVSKQSQWQTYCRKHLGTFYFNTDLTSK